MLIPSRTPNLLALVALTLLPSAVAAQGVSNQARYTLSTMGADANLGITMLPGRAAPATGGGVNLTETTILHLGVSAEGGYDSNVFFSNTDKVNSPTLRVIPFLQLTNAARSGAVPSRVFYDLTANLLYREFLSDDPNVKQQRAFNPSVSLIVESGASQSISFALTDTFVRVEDPPYGPGQGNITRNNNVGAIQTRWAPGGGRLAGILRYTNTVDVFENEELRYANSMGHDAILDVSWRWLPKTALYGQISQGYIHYFNDDPLRPRSNSFPLRVIAGLRGLLTEKIALNLAAGYLNGFYQEGPTPDGWGNLGGLVEATYKPFIMTSLTAGYRHEFRNSVIGNFYNVDAVYGVLRQALAQRFTLSGHVRYENRRFEGVQLAPGQFGNRNDDFVQGGVSADLFVQSWFFAGATYLYTANRSDQADLPGSNVRGVDYDKHLILGRLGVTY